MTQLAVLTVITIAVVNVAGATVINYNTLGSSFIGSFHQMAASGTSISASSGPSTATLSYTAVAAGSSFDDANLGTNISYGFFSLGFTGPEALIPFPSFTFLLKVNETAPGIGAQSIFATSNDGIVSSNSSNVNVFYVPVSFTLPSSLSPNTAFTIINPTQIVPSTTNGGVSSIQGFAIGNSGGAAAPEPTTMFLLGIGLLAIGAFRYKQTLGKKHFIYHDCQSEMKNYA